MAAAVERRCFVRLTAAVLALASLPRDLRAAKTAATALAPELFDEFLADAGWKEGDRENLDLREQLSWQFVERQVRAARAAMSQKPRAAIGPLDAKTTEIRAVLDVGLVVLALGVAHWGISDAPPGLTDPKEDSWRGPKNRGGKHLVSVTDGGVGLSHYDKGELAEFLRFSLWLSPAIGEERDRELIEPLAGRFVDGAEYATFKKMAKSSKTEFDNWTAFTRFSEAALGRRVVQHWVLSTWVERYWIPTLELIQRTGGNMEEAFVNARIRNSKTTTATCAARYAAGKPDRVAAELQAYVSPSLCSDADPSHERRHGYMRRPGAVWRYLG